MAFRKQCFADANCVLQQDKMFAKLCWNTLQVSMSLGFSCKYTCFLTCAAVNIDDLDSHGGTVVPALVHLSKAALP